VQIPCDEWPAWLAEAWALSRADLLPLVVFHLRQLPHWLYLDARQPDK
jgi:hypothetical protein